MLSMLVILVLTSAEQVNDGDKQEGGAYYIDKLYFLPFPPGKTDQYKNKNSA